MPKQDILTTTGDMQSALATAAANQATTDGAQTAQILANTNADAATKAAQVTKDAAQDAVDIVETAARKAEDANIHVKIDGLPKAISKGSAPIPTIALAASVDISIALGRAMPDLNYDVDFSIHGVGMGNVKAVVKSQTLTAVVVTITAIVAIAGGGTIKVTATSLSY